MPNGFERQRMPGSENPKEVKPVSEEYKFFIASVALSDVKKSEPKMSEEEALDYVVEHTGVDKTRFVVWLESLKNPVPSPARTPEPNRPGRYTEEERQSMWFNQGPMA